MKLTKWYAPDQKPVRKGYYQCKCCKEFFYWDNKGWQSKCFKNEYTVVCEGWRGIAK